MSALLMKLVRLPLAVFGAIAFLCSAGCSSTHTKSESLLAADFSAHKVYRKVYMVKMRHDPRGVQPKVVAALESMGFEVDVLDRDEGPNERQGSGFVISDHGYILTCAHVVGEETNATVWLGGELLYADVVRADTNADIALLKLDPPTTNHLQSLMIVTNASPTMGQEVFTIGFPLSDILGTAPRLAKGMVSSDVGMHDNPKQMQVSVEVQAGSSGSPLLNDDGGVVGMIDSTLNALNVMLMTRGTLPQNVNFAIKPDELRSFLKQAGLSMDHQGDQPAKVPFDQAKNSVVLIRSGRILPGEEQPQKLWCRVRYQYFWDMYWRFNAFYLEFFDAKTGRLVLRAGQDRDTLATEGGTIRRALRTVQNRLASAPDQAAPAATTTD